MKAEKLILFLAVMLAAASIASCAQGFETSPTISNPDYQYFEPSFQSFYSSQGIDYTTFWPDANNKDTCQPGNDFFITIAPGGCSPQIVRSDLLEDQNVPVFCKMNSIKVNPLIDVAEIRSVGFTGKYPAAVLGVSYHPSQAALVNYNPSLGSGVLSDIGYVVVLLKQQASEKNMSENIKFNLTANIVYDMRNIAGIGKAVFFLPALDNQEWANDYLEYSFWNGKGFVRAEYVDASGAKISVYSDKNTEVRSFDLRLGQTSDIIYVPGFYCRGGLRIRLDTVGVAKPSALLQVDDEKLWVVQGTQFLERCYVGKIEEIKVKDKASDWGVDVVCDGKKYTLKLSEFTGDKAAVTGNVEEYFTKAQKSVDDIVTFYPGEVYGAMALSELAALAKRIGKQEEARTIYEKLIQKYPDSTYARDAKTELEAISTFDYSAAGKVVSVKGKTHTIALANAKQPSSAEASAEVKIGGQTFNLMIGGAPVSIGSILSSGQVALKDLGDDYADIEYAVGSNKPELKRIKINEPSVLSGSTTITLTTVNIKRVAGIELIPDFPNQVTNVNFTVNIGIEKRGIKLSPSKTKEKIENLNKSIEKYGKIADRLEKWVDVQSKACFATSAILLAKNLISGFSGAGMARNRVMNGPGGWNDYCNEHKDETAYGGSFENCLVANNAKIEASVKAGTSQISKINQNIESAEQKAAKDTTGKTKYDQVFIDDSFSQFVADNKDLTVKIDGADKKLSDVFQGQTKEQIAENVKKMYDKGAITMENMKDMMLYGGAGMGTEIDALRSNEVGSIVKNVDTRYKGVQAELAATSIDEQIGGANARSTTLSKTQPAEANVYTVTATDSPLKGKQVVRLTTVPGIVHGAVSDVLMEVSKDSTGQYKPTGNNYIVVKDSAGKISYPSFSPDQNIALSKYLADNNVASFRQSQQTQCSHRYLNAKVKYFDSGPFKGKAAVVPVDTARGWYAAVKPDIYGVGKPYTDAGQVMSMRLCNVGQNGQEDFDKGTNDDEPCIDINFQTGQPLNQLGTCFSASEAESIARQAKSLLEQASAKYGSKQVEIGSGSFPATAAASVVGAKCTDFMSPLDCKLMFNVCDPVLCPNSRCDLGGAYPVADVIQSGIIGGMVLCLPNFKEGVYLPVCLTGIKEGLKGYVSLLESHRNCLQENLATGKQVGICDEMYSIYMCEFIWRQMGPLLDAGIVKIVEAIFKQGHGGGEYMTVNYAWENMKASTAYLQNIYSSTIPRIFKVRSVGEAGTEVCKSFVSTNYPIIGGLADTLMSPESPAQFHAWYDEIPFSEATVPPTSQYKLYYHIYAGSDSGAYYTVYLKSPPAAGYYAEQAQYVVASGYINVGETADTTKDFTAPSGYKELCIRINQQEECGFQRVSSSFALDYLNDKYVQEQATEKVDTESQCVGGTSSLYALAQPNIQEGAAEMAQPSIYNRGLVRVCSSANPGESTNPGRWEMVGSCDRNKGISCWLDKESVSNAIQGVGIENATVGQIQQTAREMAAGEDKIFDQQETSTEITKLFNEQGRLEDNIFLFNDKTKRPAILQEIAQFETHANEIVNKGFLNSDRANALYMKFQVYKDVVEQAAESNKLSTPTGTAPATATETAAATKTAAAEVFSLEKQYKPEEKINILLSGGVTGIYLENNKVMVAGYPGSFGDVTNGKINLANFAKTQFEQLGIKSAYDALNGATISGTKISFASAAKQANTLACSYKCLDSFSVKNKLGVRTLSMPITGTDVGYLQCILNNLGYDSGAIDCIAGDKTTSAVKFFQKASGISVDGIAGPQTISKLKTAFSQKWTNSADYFQ